MFIDRFPASAVIFQKRGKGLSAYFDKARFIEKTGETYYELKKGRIKFRPSSFDDFVIMNKGKPLILLYEYSRGMIVPISLADIEAVYKRDKNKKIIRDEKGNPIIDKMIDLKALPEDMAFWGQMRRWKAEERHRDESWFQRNKEIILLMAVGMFMVILSYIFMTSISDSANSISGSIASYTAQMTGTGGVPG